MGSYRPLISPRSQRTAQKETHRDFSRWSLGFNGEVSGGPSERLGLAAAPRQQPQPDQARTQQPQRHGLGNGQGFRLLRRGDRERVVAGSQVDEHRHVGVCRAESTWAFECTANTRRGHDSDSVGLADYRTADRRRRLQDVGGALTIGTRKTGTRGVADEVERERDVAGGGPAKEPLARGIGDGRGIDVEVDDRDGGRSDREEEFQLCRLPLRPAPLTSPTTAVSAMPSQSPPKVGRPTGRPLIKVSVRM